MCVYKVGDQILSHATFKQIYLTETLRKYPSVASVEHICRKDFQMPDSKHILSEGKSFIIPLLAIQRDEKHFEDPLSFKPQRFIQDSKSSKADCFISFGLGAKTCIGRQASMEMSVALSKWFYFYFVYFLSLFQLKILLHLW